MEIGIICARFEPISGLEDYSGAGSILSIADDRTFNDKGTIGSWSVNSESFMVNNSYAMPYMIEDANLIMSVNINGEQYLMIYERY